MLNEMVKLAVVKVCTFVQISRLTVVSCCSAADKLGGRNLFMSSPVKNKGGATSGFVFLPLISHYVVGNKTFILLLLPFWTSPRSLISQ